MKFDKMTFGVDVKRHIVSKLSLAIFLYFKQQNIL
jgi:hypothetical protein